MKGTKVYLVGAGPGRPDLITVRGLNILKEADVVIYDYLVDKELLKYAKEGAELICCDKFGRDKINNLLIKKAREGQKVIRLKNGDPSIFARTSQELEALARERIEFEIVPGITGAIAASCLSGIPLTDRRFASSCIFAAGHEDPAKRKSLIDWKNITKNGTVVLYMSVNNLNNTIEKILNSGRDKDTPVAIVQDASLLSQRVLTGTLENIIKKAEKEKLRPPAIVIIGEVAKLDREFNWLKRNKRILFTGLSKERFFTKDIYFHLPLIKIKPLRDYREFDGYLKKIREFDWLVFASRYGVEYFFKRFQVLGYDARALGNIKVAAIGNSTKSRLLDFGIVADLVPKKESSEGLLERFQKEKLKGKRIFLPRSDISDKGLEKGLKRFGAKVSASFAYRNVMPDDLPDLDLESFDEIMFTSPSTVRNFKRRYKNLSKGIKVRCIGEVTLREAKKCKLVD